MRIAPKKRTLIDTAPDPLPDIRVSKLLEGANVSVISVLYVFKRGKGIHSEVGFGG